MKKLHPIVQFLIILSAIGLILYLLGAHSTFGLLGYGIFSIALALVMVFFMLD